MNLKSNDHQVNNKDATEDKNYPNYHFIHFRRNFGLPNVRIPHNAEEPAMRLRIK